MGYATKYNQRHRGMAWEILGYLHDGSAHCVPCAELIWIDEALAGVRHTLDRVSPLFYSNDAEAAVDGPAPLFAVDASAWRDSGDHRSGCGLSCDTCGAVVVEGCAE